MVGAGGGWGAELSGRPGHVAIQASLPPALAQRGPPYPVPRLDSPVSPTPHQALHPDAHAPHPGPSWPAHWPLSPTAAATWILPSLPDTAQLVSTSSPSFSLWQSLPVHSCFIQFHQSSMAPRCPQRRPWAPWSGIQGHVAPGFISTLSPSHYSELFTAFPIPDTLLRTSAPAVSCPRDTFLSLSGMLGRHCCRVLSMSPSPSLGPRLVHAPVTQYLLL